jgi:hypothetical protein
LSILGVRQQGESWNEKPPENWWIFVKTGEPFIGFQKTSRLNLGFLKVWNKNSKKTRVYFKIFDQNRSKKFKLLRAKNSWKWKIKKSLDFLENRWGFPWKPSGFPRKLSGFPKNSHALSSWELLWFPQNGACHILSNQARRGSCEGDRGWAGAVGAAAPVPVAQLVVPPPRHHLILRAFAKIWEEVFTRYDFAPDFFAAASWSSSAGRWHPKAALDAGRQPPAVQQHKTSPPPVVAESRVVLFVRSSILFGFRQFCSVYRKYRPIYHDFVWFLEKNPQILKFKFEPNFDWYF